MPLRILIFCALFLVSQPGVSGVSFSQTRIVYDEGGTAKITAINRGGQLYLLQAGVVTAPNNNEATPFKVLPGLSRLEGDSESILRIQGDSVRLSSLPRDRESVFYFFGTAIPAKPKDFQEGQVASVSIGLRTVLKLFYRPTGLVGKPGDVVAQLNAGRAGANVVIRNPTAYHATFAKLTFDGKQVDFEHQPSMIAPYSEVVFRTEHRPRQVSWSLISDYGGETDERNVTL